MPLGIKVVIDSSVWIAGIGSRAGFASEAILKSYKNPNIEIFISSEIITEIKRNLIKKFKFEDFLAEKAETVIKNLCDGNIAVFLNEERVVKSINPKDRHILLLCQEVGADYLVTFDRKHLLSLKKYQKTLIMEPRDFIKRT